MKATKRAGTILIHRTGQLGDTLVSLPAIRAIRDGFPEHNLVLLTDRQENEGFVSSWDVLGATEIFTDVIFYTAPSERPRGRTGIFDLVRQIRQQRAEAIFCLRDPHWSRPWRDRLFFQLVCGIPKYYAAPPRPHQVFGRRDDSGNLIRYPREADYLLRVVESAGVPTPEVDEAALVLPSSDEARYRIDFLWADNAMPAEGLIFGLAPGSKMPSKRWPLERFIEVGKSILTTFQESRIVIFGGAGDRVHGNAIRQALGNRVTNLAGELTLLESAEALRRCSLYIGNDTGTMHLAAAAGTTCIVIFSARDHPGRWDPYGPRHVLLRTDPPCAGCLLETCVEQDMRCLKEISIDSVVEAIRNVVNSDSCLEQVASGCYVK